MRPELKDIEKIEQYLEGKLNVDDSTSFESDFQKDIDFQQQFVGKLKELAFLEEVEAYHKANITNPKTKTSRWKWWLLLALLALGALALLWSLNRGLESDVNWMQGSNDEPQIEMTTRMVAIDPARFREDFVIVKVRNGKATKIKLKDSKSTLTVPQNAVVDEQGNKISGTYEIHYREYRNSAQMAFSGVKMYEGNQRFQSAGMLEIRAFQDGFPVQLNPETKLLLDYELTDRMEDLSLYQLEEENEKWTNQRSIQLPLSLVEFQKIEKEKASIVAIKIKEMQAKERLDSIRNVKNYTPSDTAVITYGNTVDVGNIPLKRIPDANIEIKPIVMQAKKPKRHIVRHKHNPKLVKGLELSSFGIYNCGKSYQVENGLVVYPKYTQLNKQQIEQAKTLSVIDLDYNAAYSFEPSTFVCNRKAANVFLLWTKDGKLYSFFKSKKQQMGDKTSTKLSLTMDDISTEVQGTNDLKKYLSILNQENQKQLSF